MPARTIWRQNCPFGRPPDQQAPLAPRQPEPPLVCVACAAAAHLGLLVPVRRAARCWFARWTGRSAKQMRRWCREPHLPFEEGVEVAHGRRPTTLRSRDGHHHPPSPQVPRDRELR